MLGETRALTATPMEQVHPDAEGDALTSTHAMGDGINTVIDALLKMP